MKSAVTRAARASVVASIFACYLTSGCSSDDHGSPNSNARLDGSVDAGRAPGTTLDAGLDALVTPPLGPDPHDGGGIGEKVVFSAITPGGHDRYFGVTHDSAGNIYAVGQTAPSTDVGADFSFVLAKYSADGVLDTTFGTAGFAIQNVTVGGAGVEAARGVVIQADGKIVVAGDAEHQAYPNEADAGAGAADADLCLLRFTASGQLDTSFGSGGIVRYNLADGIVTQPVATDANPTPAAVLNGTDAFWSLIQTADGKLVVHSATRGLGPNMTDGGVRTDADFALVRMFADGGLDPTFGASGPTPGVVRTDFSNTEASVRGVTLLSDDTLVGSGYTNSNLLTGNQFLSNPVLYKLLADGTADATFATTDQVPVPGVWYDFARTDMKSAEAYGAVQQAGKFVAFGYGPTPNAFGNGTTDLVWFRYNADGSLDDTFGSHGQTFQDVAGYDDNGRSLATLPDNKIIGTGRATPKPPTVPHDLSSAPADALISIIDQDGQPYLAFGRGGVRLYDFGGPQDHLWQVAVAPDQKHVTTVGTQTGAATNADDNAALVILTLP